MRRAALVLAIALVAPVTWLAEPARACSCSTPDPVQEVRDGQTVAVLTVLARDNFDVTYRVDASNHPLPDRILESEQDNSCDMGAHIGRTLAVTMREEEDTYVSSGWDNYCHQMEVGPTLTAIRGVPTATAAGEPVAVVTGRFGGNRLVAVDARGQAVAWKPGPATTDSAAVCPGGRTMVTIGFDKQPGPAGRELTVIDARTLATRRTVVVSTEETGGGSRPRCLDPDGNRVQFLGRGSVPKSTGLFEAHGAEVRRVADVTVRLNPYLQIAGPDGYVSRAGTRRSGEFVAHVDSAGKVRRLADLSMIEGIEGLAVDPTGTTVAVLGKNKTEPAGEGYDESLGRQTVVTLDVRSGEVLATWTPTASADQLAWDGAGRLAVRVGYRSWYDEFRPGVVHLLDRDLRTLGTRPAPFGPVLAALGDTVVAHGADGYASAPMVLSGPTGTPRALDNLWLAAAAQVLPLGTAGFAPDAGDSGPIAAFKVSTAVAGGSTDDGLPFVLGGLGVVVAALSLAAWPSLLRRRPHFGVRGG